MPGVRKAEHRRVEWAQQKLRQVGIDMKPTFSVFSSLRATFPAARTIEANSLFIHLEKVTSRSYNQSSALSVARYQCGIVGVAMLRLPKSKSKSGKRKIRDPV